jgi:cell division septation protein DedD
MAENLKAPTQEITPETRFSVRQRFFALIGAGALLVGATACGADEKVGATPSPVETSTSQSTDPTEAPTKGPTAPAETISPSPSPSETTSLRPTAPETETAVAEIPNLRKH